MNAQATAQPKESAAYRLLRDAKAVCFVGDSLTEGTMNGGVPWYAPMQDWMQGEITNISQGGATTESLLAFFLPAIVRAEADLYVFAIGANDILFRDPTFCAMTATEYVKNLQRIRDAICEHRPDARFIFIAPWLATDGYADILGGEKPPDADEAYRDYTAALLAWCRETGDLFVNANDHIAHQFSLRSQNAYLVDFIHPNADAGVRLYAHAVLMSECGVTTRNELIPDALP